MLNPDLVWAAYAANIMNSYILIETLGANGHLTPAFAGMTVPFFVV